MLGEAAVGVGLADLVHLARQLRQQLHPHHAVLGLTLGDKTLFKIWAEDTKHVFEPGGTW